MGNTYLILKADPRCSIFSIFGISCEFNIPKPQLDHTILNLLFTKMLRTAIKHEHFRNYYISHLHRFSLKIKFGVLHGNYYQNVFNDIYHVYYFQMLPHSPITSGSRSIRLTYILHLN